MYAGLLNQAYKAAIAAADPLQCLGPQHLPARPKGRTLVVGAGKAAASMALAVERLWPKDAPLEGLVITRYAHGLPLTRLQCMEAGHPVPDEAGQKAAQTIAQRVTELTPDDQLLVLVSGGGSSLLALPAPGLSMDDLRAVTQQLLRSGAPIQDMNVVRRHLSRLQGGQLALMSKAPVQTLVISDVVGDQACDIASGPCDPDPSSFEDARAVLARWNVEPPRAVAERLEAGCHGAVAETPKPGDSRLAHATTLMLATAKASLDEASRILGENGFQTLCLGDGVTGEARDVAGVMASLVREIASNRIPEFKRPMAIVSGGECTVTVRGSGQGGRCSEFLLAHGLALEALGVGPCVWGLAADSDGIDGSSDAAGAYFDPGFLSRARAQGLDPRRCLDNNDALSLFRALGTHLCTGPTRTNVNDIRLLWSWHSWRMTQEPTNPNPMPQGSAALGQRLRLREPDDWHLHLRDGAMLKAVAPYSARQFGRALVMPNLQPPVITVAMAEAYSRRIGEALAGEQTEHFRPFMTLYLTDNTSCEEVDRAAQSPHVLAFKLYPAGATTHSDAGVTNLQALDPVFERMAEKGVVLCIHGEVTTPEVDVFDREARFIEERLIPLRHRHPELRIVFEHATTREAVDYVRQANAPIAATITPQHLLYNRNALFRSGLRPHYYCLPVLKREPHRQALVAAATSGSPRFFMGTDSAPHDRTLKEADCGCAGCFSAPFALELYAQVFDEAQALDRLEAFASHFGADFYGLPRNAGEVELLRQDHCIADRLSHEGHTLVPLAAGQVLRWQYAGRLESSLPRSQSLQVSSA